MDGRTELARLVDRCVVRVYEGEARGGSGFLAAPGVVLTCAHVVGQARTVAIYWGDLIYVGTARAVPERHDGEGLWGYPDLALIRVEGLPDGHPYVWLGDRYPNDGATLYASGFKRTYAPEPALGGVQLVYDAPYDVNGQPMLAFSEGELAAGMSGGPVLDPVQGAVCGVLTTTRKEGWAQGGLGTPVDAIREHFPEIWTGQPPGHDEWRRLRAALVAPGVAGVDVAALRSDLERIPDRLNHLYSEVFDGLRPPPEGPLMPEDLIREASDSLLPGDGSAHPLVRLRQEVDTLLRAPRRPRTAMIEIHLTTAGANVRKLLVSVWTYQDVAGTPVALFCADSALSADAAREKLREVLRRAITSLTEAEDVIVEFVLPYEMLGNGADAVDEWYLDKPYKPLGVQFPVVIRTRDRPPDALVHGRRRWKSLQEAEPVLQWVDCRAKDHLEQWYAAFQGGADRTLLMIGYQPCNEAGGNALEAAYDAGLPAALWRRTPCAEHSTLVDTEVAECSADRFRATLTARLAGQPVRRLPWLVKSLRAEAQARGPGGDHLGRGLTLLWDDPTRQDPDSAALTGPGGGTR